MTTPAQTDERRRRRAEGPPRERRPGLHDPPLRREPDPSEWHPLVHGPVDVLRFVFVGATLYWAATQHWTAVGLAIASAVLIWARTWRIPWPYDLGLIVAMALIAWGTALGAYGEWRYYNKVVHSISPALWLPALYLVFVRLGALPKLEDLRTPHNRVGLFLILWAVGFSVGSGYELAEWVSTVGNVDPLSKSLTDSMTDLFADLGGSAAGAALFVGWSTRHRGRDEVGRADPRA